MIWQGIPGETRDVSDDHPEVPKEFLEEMETNRTESDIFPLVSQ